MLPTCIIKELMHAKITHIHAARQCHGSGTLYIYIYTYIYIYMPANARTLAHGKAEGQRGSGTKGQRDGGAEGLGGVRIGIR